MIDEKIIKKLLLDMRNQCKKGVLCKNCPYKKICLPHMAYQWEDDEIENMAAGWYEMLNDEVIRNDDSQRSMGNVKRLSR